MCARAYARNPRKDHRIRTLRIIHETRYRYDRPVTFGAHRLMIRPRDGHDMRILDSTLTVSPQADVHWAFDTFGNSVAFLSFLAPADELLIKSELLLRRYGLDEPLARITRFAGDYPVVYDADEQIDLAPFMMSEHPDEQPAVADWIAQVMPDLAPTSMDVLAPLAALINKTFRYNSRDAEGVQTPAETIRLGSGTCRDFALFFMEAARHLGFAARFVTGYLHDEAAANPDQDMTGGGATHAWADIFVPGAGWVEFDPTNRIIGSRNLVRVATTRRPSQAMPVAGSFSDQGGDLIEMHVSVSVAEESEPAPDQPATD